ncbi:MAG: HD domain-containing protein [Syntrophobacterales bacterium]|jgi:tRNA nucleotidyltransferase/poly(A) polymerase
MDEERKNLRNHINYLLQNSGLMSALVNIAQRDGHQLYLVGGFIRDILLGRSSKDVDFVAPRAAELANSLATETGTKLALIDRKFGTIRLIPSPLTNDLSDFYQVDLSPLRGSSIAEDLNQRDFTVNALAVKLSAWQSATSFDLIDPLGGLSHLRARRLHLCSPHSLEDDPLRILRAYRLAATHDFTLEAHAQERIGETLHGLNRVSVERIRDELVLILSTANSAPILRVLDDDNVLRLLLPECEPMRNCSQNGHHHQDVWQHSLSALEVLESFLASPQELLGGYADEALPILAQRIAGERTREIMLKLGVLLHDIGKPNCRTVDENGVTVFTGHEVTGARLAGSLCARFCYSNKEIDFVRQLIHQQMRVVHPFSLKRTSRKALSHLFILGPELFWSLLFLFGSDYLAAKDPRSRKTEIGPLRHQMNKWLDFYHKQLKPKEKEPPLVRGHELMNRLNLSPGPTVGKLLHTLAELQWEGRINSREEALQHAAQLLKQWKR